MSQFFAATALTGGAAGALDAIDGDALATGDAAMVVTSGASYDYYLNASSGAAEASPNIIAPDTNAGNKRWIKVIPLLSNLGLYSGSSTFAGSAGATVSIGATLASTSYSISIVPTADAEDVGAIWAASKTTSTFKVHCSGTGTPTFDWQLLYNN